MALVATFEAPLWRYPGPGGWFFVTVPPDRVFPVVAPFGRTPVDACVDGHTWRTSTWRDATGQVVLAVPKKVRGQKDVGDAVAVTLTFDGRIG